ncbi:cytidylyltransferase domain-containing protein [Shewanella spartinae]|uniref:acylneuraminate cytidylyltransferase family protein n=1 Tax=Shewanella spartinae TaxID=2864205 RepID=UPI001C6563CB|nr:acylneuraminate cytidylyltransferase family protein [Shewanella spartinae]QYJ95157.1 acylneuraminate cytidylyltransferase family protein [Shewanella spartinae]
MIIAVIPARSGSKGFPNKNIACVGGKTLLEHAIKVGLDSKCIDKVYVSTDSLEYLKIAMSAGAFSLGIRPDTLSGDDVSTVDVLEFMLGHPDLVNVTHVVLLQPTSPIRTSHQIDDCVTMAIESRQSVVSIAKVEDPHPFKMKKIVDGKLVSYIDGCSSETARQSLPSVYELTGAIYVSSKENLLNNHSLFSNETKPYIQDRFVNIDMKEDLDYLEFLLAAGKVEIL